jgi:integrase
MSALPPHLAPGTRRKVAKALRRALSLAAYPAKLIPHNPIPQGWLPKAADDKAKGCLYPDEDGRLLGATKIPLCFRVYYGALAREGWRADEAGRTEWTDVDLERGAIKLDENKTNDPRAWALSPDLVRALRAWRKLNPEDRYVFKGIRGNRLPGTNAAERFRGHLKRAGVDRPELYERSATRLQVRLHDLRATFITIKLANGRTETWIADRTGHRSSGQINKYRRGARTFAELGLGDLAPMDKLIPEFRSAAVPTPPQDPEEGRGAPAPETPTTAPAPARAARQPQGAKATLGPGWAMCESTSSGSPSNQAVSPLPGKVPQGRKGRPYRDRSSLHP